MKTTEGWFIKRLVKHSTGTSETPLQSLSMQKTGRTSQKINDKNSLNTNMGKHNLTLQLLEITGSRFDAKNLKTIWTVISGLENVCNWLTLKAGGGEIPSIRAWLGYGFGSLYPI